MSPLVGKRIVVTRAARQAGPLCDALVAGGATVLAYPCVEVTPPADTLILDATLHAAADGKFDWIALTSANAADAVSDRLRELGLHLPDSVRIAAVGPATADHARTALGETILTVASDDHSAETLARLLPLNPGARVLLPQSTLTDDALPRALAARGAIVAVAPAYDLIRGRGGVDLPALLRAGEVDAITVTSGSTATNLLARVGDEGGEDAVALLRQVPVICIGRRTADSTGQLGLRVAAVAERQGAENLAEAVQKYFESGS
jgi:uroporphyrinogen-III synthase